MFYYRSQSGCLDADDGFSIYTKGDTLFLAIHIADPTYYISLESQLWNDIQERVLTRYPSNHPPIHMIPHTIMDQASLTPTRVHLKLKAISIRSRLNSETYFPTDMVNQFFQTSMFLVTLHLPIHKPPQLPAQLVTYLVLD